MDTNYEYILFVEPCPQLDSDHLGLGNIVLVFIWSNFHIVQGVSLGVTIDSSFGRWIYEHGQLNRMILLLFVGKVIEGIFGVKTTSNIAWGS